MPSFTILLLKEPSAYILCQLLFKIITVLVYYYYHLYYNIFNAKVNILIILLVPLLENYFQL